MSPDPSPTVKRRRMGIELRKLREAAGLTLEQVGEEMEWSRSKVSRIENARVVLRARDVGDLCELYNATGEQREMLIRLARQAKEKGWWAPYSDAIPDWFEIYVGLEAEAKSLRNYEAEFVPGLLQSREYASALHRASMVSATTEEIERQVDVRMARQEFLRRPGAPRLWTVLNEAVIRRPVGSRDDMVDQLRHLVETAKSLPNLTLQVLPFQSGAHPAMLGAFMILEFPEAGDRDVVYLENVAGGLYLEKPSETERYALIFDHIRMKALDQDDSLKLIEKAARDL